MPRSESPANDTSLADMHETSPGNEECGSNSGVHFSTSRAAGVGHPS